MAPVIIAAGERPVERRREPRHAGGGARFGDRAILRPGQRVILINITTHAALVESDSRLRPGAQTEVQFTAGEQRASFRGRLDRCYVASLEPLRYRGLVIFEHALDL